MKRLSIFIPVLLVLLLASSGLAQLRSGKVKISSGRVQPVWLKQAISKLERDFFPKFNEAARGRLRRGVDQAASFWRDEDGKEEVFEQFVKENFAADKETLDQLFSRFENHLEQLGGRLQEIGREFRMQSDLDSGPILFFDDIFAAYDPSAHIADDFFKNKLAFIVLLNFPLTSLEQRLANGKNWSRREWAETRLAQRFSSRVPSSVNADIAKASSDSERYIAEYNIWMHHLVNEKGVRIFPAKLRLLSHWNLRDEISANYSSDDQTSLAKQRLIQKVMERIVDQTIPAAVIDNPGADWDPYTNQVKPTALIKDNDGPPKPPKANVKYNNSPEPDTRYAMLLADFRAARKADPYSPTARTFIARSFNEYREIPEARVKAMLEEVLSSPLRMEVGTLISRRLGRPLEPFDIWYTGFKPRGKYTESQLDEIVSKRYPNAEAFKKDIPNLLMKLSFTKQRAEFLAENILVEPARGSGHALGAGMRTEKARLRTRVEKTGMNYKGFNIAIHELGHNVEQTFSLNKIDHYMLRGVPNNAFTEALAFIFQERDLELLGLTEPDSKSRSLQTLQDFWDTNEIAGVALVDMTVWHWMYDNPNATPAELKAATVRITKEVWNKYYAPVFGKRDVVLLGIYSHMINSFLYLPDYSLGYLIAFQIKEQMNKAGDPGAEFERMTTVGNIAPDLWMEKATGSPVTADALLNATKKALAELK